jgi:8-oxo-dGTP pyrophosphatase MutT (NUDIX family)
MHVSRDRKAQIRPVALALVADLERLLLMRVEDADTGSTGYRPLGGTIEFGEYGAETVAREFREELGTAVTSRSGTSEQSRTCSPMTVSNNMSSCFCIRGTSLNSSGFAILPKYVCGTILLLPCGYQ